MARSGFGLASRADGGTGRGDDRDVARAPAGMGGGRPEFREPTFGQRLVARVIDSIVVLPGLFALRAVVDGPLLAAVALVLVAVYEISLVTLRGQTIGKMVMSTRVVDRTSGAVPTLQQSMIRWFTVVAGSLVAIVGPAVDPFATVYTVIVLAPVMRPPLHLGVHDLTARTIVTTVDP